MRIAPALLCALLCLPVCAQRRTPVIIDTDIGDAIDDALALALAVNSPELDIRGVTTVVDDVESKTRLAVKELNILGRRDIPVAMGAPEPLLDPVMQTHPREFEVLTPADAVPPGPRAVNFLVDTLMQSQDRITLVPIGPLTNLALALKAEPRIKQKIERIVLMGGAFSTKKIEYNVKRDPAAAEIVFRSGIPITAVGLDVTEPCKLRPEDMDRLRLAESPAAHFLLQLIQLSREETGEMFPTLYDPLAIAVVFRPELIETAAGKVSVSLADATRGQTQFTAGGGVIQIGVKVNPQAFLDLFIDRVARNFLR